MATIPQNPSTMSSGLHDVMSPLLTATVHARDGVSQDLMPTTYQSPSMDISGFTPDLSMVREENRSLKNRLRQLQSDCQTEQDTVYNLRKKSNNQDRERLETVAKLNAEISHMDGEVTKLRAHLERGEAGRQTLEYELAKARKDINSEKKNAGEKESLMAEVADSMKQKVTELTAQLENLCEELENSKAQAQEEAVRLRSVIDDKEQMISEYRTQKDAHDAERDRFEAAITQKDKRICDLEDKLQELEGKDHQTTETLRQQMTESELLKEKEDRLQREYERALDRIRTLEESIEAERAAHLESKFNSEIVQLRIRDLENALELEKTTKTEALAGSEKLNKQVRDLQQVYEDERRNGLLSREKLENAEKEYAALNKQLHHELEDKRLVIQKLSGQLDVHQKNFEELKQELNKAKKRQIYLEETYTGSIKEMEILLNNFSLEPPAKQSGGATAGRKKATTTTKTKKEGGKSQSLAVLQESMRHLLIDYRRKLDDATADLSRVKSQNDNLQKECHQYKDVMWAKDKALESTQQAMSRTSKELRKSQTDLKELDTLSQQQREQLEDCQRQLDKERKANKVISEQMNKISTKWKTGEQVSLEFLQTLYQQLQTAQKSSQPGPTAHPTPKEFKSWTDLALHINDQVALVLTVLSRTQDKVYHLEHTLANKDTQLESIQKVHEDQLEKLGAMTEGRTNEWLKQKGDMETHYAQLLAEIHTRQKKTQTLADQAWEKVRVTDSVQLGLERECAQLGSQLAQSQKEHDTLLATCALLCGTFYPLYARYSALAAQRDHLVEQLAAFHAFKQEIQVLVETLSMGSGSDVSPTDRDDQKSARGLLRFRKAAVAVMVANRLMQGSKGNCKMFTVHDTLPGVYSMLVCTGYVQPITKSFKGISDQNNPDLDKVLRQGQDLALSWLSSSDLLSTILATMSDLQVALQKAKQGDASANSQQVVSVTKNCFQKLLCHFPSMFPSLQQEATPAGRDRGLLVRRLEQGLARAVVGKPPAAHLASSQTILTGLQEQVLSFTQRLHTAEVERRNLRLEVTSLRQERESWTCQAGTLDQAAEEVINLRKQVENQVPRDHFESVCQELNSALYREQQAQQLLNDQSEQLHEVGMRLDIQLTEDKDKDETLGQAVKGLTEAKMELKRQEQRFRQQNKQLSMVEEEKLSLQENIRDAENALKTASRDKETVTNYVRNVEKALESIKSHFVVTSTLTHKPDFTGLLSPDLVPSHLGKPGADFAACQKLVAAFVECQRQLNAHITALQGEVRSHKEHICTLKKELSDACRREYEDELEKIKLGDYNFDDLPVKLTYTSNDQLAPPTRAVIGSQSVEEFSPLIEDSGESFIAQEIGSTPTKQGTKTRPPVSNRHSTTRRKPTEGKA